MNKNRLETPVQYLKGVGPKIAKILAKINVFTVEDLLYYFPCDYEDRRTIQPISSIRGPENRVLIKGVIEDIEHNVSKGRFSIIKVDVADNTGSVKVIFFNQPFLLRLFSRGLKLIISGKAEFNAYEGSVQIIPRDWEIDDGKALGIVPIYNMTEGLYAKLLRKIVKTAIDNYLSEIKDILPEEIITQNKFISITDAVSELHFPKNLDIIASARKRVIFEEFFLFQLGFGLIKKQDECLPGIVIKSADEALSEFPLPFELTNAQDKVLKEIFTGLKSGKRMNRLLMGDVGSGKTIVAAITAYTMLKNGYQVVVMAPTEILAQQHFAKFSEWLSQFKIRLVTGTTQSRGRKSQLDDDVIIGTHALIEDEIKFKNLGLAIIDEQHRFGVIERSILSQKGTNPHLLFMTATPIPRSLALTLYGDLDRSTIDEMPKGRQVIKTHYIPDKKRSGLHEFIRKKVGEGQQVFVVCPLVLESEKLDLKAAIDEAKYLQGEVFSDLKVGLLHGRMKPKEKEEIMEDFRLKKIKILVSTTVIEVGIDIKDASIMLIEHSERFGLSQLHQLRGRIGRGPHESFCFLLGNIKTEEAKIRIKAMLDYIDGFKIAEIDLKLRGPGDFSGLKQSGLPSFHLADIIRDEQALMEAKEAAFDYVKNDSMLKNSPLLLRAVKTRYGKFFGY